MAIEIQKRPYNYCFSGNPVHYQLYSAQAAADDKIFFEIRVMFKSINGDYAATESLSYYPVAGIAPINVQDLLEGLLTYELPGFDVDEKKVWEATGQTGKFYLQFREITTANPDPSWDNSELDHERFIIKGGISRFKYGGNNFWVNYFAVNQPFLTWQVNGRLAAIGERMYLAFLVDDQPAIGELKAIITVTYTDGETEKLSRDFAVVKGLIYYIPAGARQWGVEALQPAKEIWYWDIQVFDYSDGGAPVTVSEKFKYENDNRNDYNDLTLSYRNSLGGLDSVRVRGVIQYDLDYDYTEQGSVQRADYYKGSSFDPQKTVFNNKELQVLRGDIGYLQKEEQDRLRDALVKRETWREVSKKWWPYMIVTKNIKQKTTEQTKWSLPIDFTLAHEGDYSYTPESVDFGEGVFDDNVCLAKLSPVEVLVDISGADAQITIDGTEVDSQNASAGFRYRVLNQDVEVIGWTNYNYADLPLIFHLDKDEVFLYEIQSICTNNVYGRKTTGVIDTTDNVYSNVYNSAIINKTNTATEFALIFSDPLIGNFSGANVGANNSFPFNTPDSSEPDGTVTIVFNDINPSSAVLKTNGVEHLPFSINGGEVIFKNITIVGGFTITIE